MPELPEVETIRTNLAKLIIGQTITSIDIMNIRSVVGDTNSILGSAIVSIRRFGKYLVLDTTDRMCIGIHLKMSGQLRYNSQPHSDVHRHTRAVIRFDGGGTLEFRDQRKFGKLEILTEQELQSLPFILRLASDPWQTSDDGLYQRLHSRRIPIKTAILDQSVVAGVGNIYANDGLWLAYLRPDRPAASLSLADTTRLRSSLIAVMEESLKYQGSTTIDRSYVQPDGTSGSYQDHFKVYARTGKPCLRDDGGIIRKWMLGGRGTYACPVCQK